jgi:hypothetical protein
MKTDWTLNLLFMPDRFKSFPADQAQELLSSYDTIYCLWKLLKKSGKKSKDPETNEPEVKSRWITELITYFAKIAVKITWLLPPKRPPL